MIWLCFAGQYKGKLIFIDGIMDSYKFLEVLIEGLEYFWN